MAQVVTKVDDVQRRAAAIEQASVKRLEGLELDAAAVALTQRYVAGDLTSDDLLEEMIHLPLRATPVPHPWYGDPAKPTRAHRCRRAQPFRARMTIVRIAQLETGCQHRDRHVGPASPATSSAFRMSSSGPGCYARWTWPRTATCSAAPQFIESAAADIFRDVAAKRHLRDLPRTEFVAAAAGERELLSALNLHPFREGNGRTQRAFLSRMAAQASWTIDWTPTTLTLSATSRRPSLPSKVTIVR
jgi:hypothetical protein